MSERQIQCIVKRAFTPLFPSNPAPRLLYVSRIEPSVTQSHPIMMHAHETLAELVLIYSGSSSFLIGEQRCSVRPGSLLVYNSGVVHDEAARANDAIASYCVALDGLHLPSLRENAFVADDAPVVYDTGAEYEPMRALCAMMHEALADKKTDCESFAHYLMLALLDRVRAVTHMVEPPSLSTEPNILGQRIREYIDQHYTEPLTLQTIGDALHVSTYYLAHVFKDTSGYSPMQYLLRRRIGKAQNLLLSTDLPISRVSELVGFETQNYFNQQFIKRVGVPPTKFRKDFMLSGAKPPKPDGK